MANRFEQMRAFAGVVEAGGFTRAVDRTGMSRAVVSRNIQELEDRLGVRLLNRTTRQVSLTQAGNTFYEKCRRILDDLDEAERSISDEATGPRGVLRVVAPVNFGLSDLGPAIADFLLQFANIRIELSLNDRIVDPIEAGYDVAIRVRQTPPDLPMTLDACKITESSRILCGAPHYLRARGEPRTPQELSRYECLCYSYVEEPTVWRLTRSGEEHAVHVTSRIVTSASSVLATAAERGLGVAYGPTAFFRDALKRGALVRVLPEYDLPKVAIYSLFARGRHIPPKLQAFNAFMQDYFAKVAESGVLQGFQQSD